MSIESHIKAAQVLVEANMHHEALSNIMIAIAGSARKLYPQGTLSKNPRRLKQKMGDKESFTLFLGQRLARILICNYASDNSGIVICINNEDKLLEEILYHNYRCELIHEAGLPIGIEFVKGTSTDATIRLGANSIVLDYAWLSLLISVVVNAPSNYDIFGGFKRLETTKGTLEEDQFRDDVISKFNITLGRYEILKEVCAVLGIENILLQDFQQLKEMFTVSFVANSSKLGFNDGIYTGLSTRNLIDKDHKLTTLGAQILKEISGFYK